MSLFSNRAPEVIEAARYFGLDARQVASDLYDDPHCPLPRSPSPNLPRGRPRKSPAKPFKRRSITTTAMSMSAMC